MTNTAGEPIIAVIVVNWNDAADTISCLDSLIALRGPGHRVYVVDNASQDDSPAQILAAHPEVELLRSPRNTGYGGGFNRGFERALGDGARFLWLLNNDATVEPGTADGLLCAAQQFGPGIYVPQVLRQVDQTWVLWYGGSRLDWRLKSYHLGEGTAAHCATAGVQEVPWGTGCSLFVPASAARRIGPMDERYFLYLEDVDWCLRARQLGIVTRYVPQARVYHGVSKSVSRLDPAALPYYSWRNYYLLLSQHGRWWQRQYGRLDLLSRFGKIAVRSLCSPAARRDRSYRARTQGLVDFARGRFGEWCPPNSQPTVVPLGDRGIA